jgi:hypothetical protein
MHMHIHIYIQRTTSASISARAAADAEETCKRSASWRSEVVEASRADGGGGGGSGSGGVVTGASMQDGAGGGVAAPAVAAVEEGGIGGFCCVGGVGGCCDGRGGACGGEGSWGGSPILGKACRSLWPVCADMYGCSSGLVDDASVDPINPINQSSNRRGHIPPHLTHIDTDRSDGRWAAPPTSRAPPPCGMGLCCAGLSASGRASGRWRS